MADGDVINLSSDSSRPSSPFINVSDVFNDTNKHESPIFDPITDHQCYNVTHTKDTRPSTKIKSSNSSPEKNRVLHNISDSDNSESETLGKTDDLNIITSYCLLERYSTPSVILPVQPVLEVETNVSNTQAMLHNSYDEKTKTSKKEDADSKKRKMETKNKSKLTKEARLEAKLQKERDKEHKRAEKIAAQESKNQMKPGTCMKYINVIVDSALVTCPFGGAVITALQNSESKYEVSDNNVPLSVSWARDSTVSERTQESDLLLIWQWQLVIPAVKNHTLCLQIQEIKTQNPGKSISLVVYGLNGYFSYLKSRRRNNTSEPSKQTKGKRNNENQEYPYVTRKEIEEELIELQIMENCNHRLIDSPDDLGQWIVNITKAIAETPFKLDKQKREMECLEWYAAGDSRDCVTVDKAGNGLLRLWQQQICQFNLAGHDVAQAIALVYPSPLSLIQAYDNCDSEREGEELLKDIPVRRCQGPLSSSRRIGPELSKKMYTFFCSTNGNAPLSQENSSTS